MTNVFISASLGGASGVVSRQETHWRGRFYNEARQYLVVDTNAAIDGSFAGGADSVLVSTFDSGLELPLDLMHPQANVVRFDRNVAGGQLCGLEGLERNFDLVMLIGQSIDQGYPQSVLSGTLSQELCAVEIDGDLVDNIDLLSALAGHYEVPVGMVTGDDTTCARANRLIPQAETVTVKSGIDTHTARCYPIDLCRARIQAAAQRAVERIGEMSPYHIGEPVNVRIELRTPNMAGRVSLIPGMCRDGGSAVVYSSPTFIEAYRTLLAALWLAKSVVVATL